MATATNWLAIPLDVSIVLSGTLIGEHFVAKHALGRQLLENPLLLKSFKRIPLNLRRRLFQLLGRTYLFRANQVILTSARFQSVWISYPRLLGTLSSAFRSKLFITKSDLFGDLALKCFIFLS